MKKLILIITSLFVFSSCNTLDEAGKVLKNEKIKTTDEFLVKKRNPLVLPPDYKEIPTPGSKKKSGNKGDKDIKEILKGIDEEVSSDKNSSTETSIIDKIRK